MTKLNDRLDALTHKLIHRPDEDNVQSLEDRIEDLEACIRGSGNTIIPGSASTASGSFVDWPGSGPSLNLTFEKKRVDTVFQIIYWTSFYITVGIGAITFAMKNMDTGVDHPVGLNHFLNETGSHRFWGGVITPLDTAVGLYNYRFRVRVSAFTPTFNVDINDFAQVAIREVVPV